MQLQQASSDKPKTWLISLTVRSWLWTWMTKSPEDDINTKLLNTTRSNVLEALTSHLA